MYESLLPPMCCIAASLLVDEVKSVAELVLWREILYQQVGTNKMTPSSLGSLNK